MFGYGEQEFPGLRMDAILDPREARPLREDGDNPVWRLHGRRKDGGMFPVGMQVRRLERSRHLMMVVLSDPDFAGDVAGSRLLATASHDLRQPLQTLRLLNQSLAEAVDGPDLRELVEHQARAIGNMGELLDALLDISKLESGKVGAQIGDMELSALFAGLEKEFSTMAAARGLVFVAEGAAPPVRSDPVLLGQILRNLLGNALKFTERGEIRLSAARAGAHVRVTVADTGIGIPGDALPKLWDEFYRVPRPGGHQADGFGLGLSIVRRLGDLIGARLAVESTPGVGTRVQVDLPPAESIAQAAPAASRRDRPSLVAAPRRLLLVEDDAGLRYATRRWLSGRGLQIEAFGDGCAALAAIAGGFAPDLVVSDLHLAEGETGIGVVDGVRAALGRDIPALVLTGDTSPSAQAAARGAGIGLLLKPVDPEELLDRIRALLA
jgi:signal transduction histidine kinase